MIQEVDNDCVYCGTSKWPLTFSVCLHIYHCTGKFKLKKEDIFNHVVFIPTLGMPGMIFDWGCLGNWLGIAYVIFVEDRYNVPKIPFIIQLIFMPFNVLYYGKQSVINYTLFQLRQYIPSQNWNGLKKLNL